ncbi:molybdenum cofactor sulfurase-like [Trifolium pratense]|uniref:molybdenum cofactor sulfurase-like n=1 Tax=Trifolium pratense TaxID=57577 RepID=UPI001E696063|nr:molybdenum cofactor sulfurase-like [Trifolium pratense]
MDDTLSQNESSKTCPQCCCTTSLFFNSPNSQNTKPSKHHRNSSSECRHTFASSTTSLIFPNTYFTNHESLPSYEESFIEFNKVFPQFSETEHVDHVRAKEYSHLSFSNHTCLDYIGIGLFSYSQMQKHVHHNDDDASKTKHSLPQFTDIPFFSISCKTGNLKTLLLHGGQDSEFESAMRKRIMNYLNISENDYFMIFTANRTSAFKLVADCYQFQKSRKLLTVYDHESEAVEAMISSSEKRGAKVMSAEFSWPRLRIQSTKLRKMIVSKRKKKKKEGLFVLPLHSRVTGSRYPYIWISVAQENGWNVLVDACALGPKDMDCFGLSLFQPDFLICSCYKVFGENPSGFGCLFIKKSVISTLETNSSAGIVNLVQEKKQHVEDSFGIDTKMEQKSVLKLHLHQEEPFYLTSFSDEFEKGEPSEIKIVSAHEELKPSQRFEIEELENQVQILEKGVQESDKNGNFDLECRCLDQVDSLGIILINDRARYLINWLVNSMLKLKHPNTEGVSLVKIYGPKVKFDRGPAMAFNIFDWKGEKVEPVLVQKLADRSNISISYGLLHHIWFADKYGDEKGRILKDKKKKDHREKIGITVVTVALGFLANFEDIYRLWCFVARFLDADFVEKERWRYTALNQKTVEV